MRRSALAAILVAALATARTARAGDEIDPAAVRAEKLAEAADAKQTAGAYAEAVELYLEANRASPAAILLFDVAVVYDKRLDAPQLALDYYRRALAAGDLEDALAAIARARIDALEPKGHEAKPDVASAKPRTKEGGLPPLAIAGVATAGAGLVALGASAVLAIVAKSKDDEAGTFCDGDRCTDPRALELTNDATGLADAATATFAIGAGLLVGGLVLWFVAPPRRDPTAVGRIRF